MKVSLSIVKGYQNKTVKLYKFYTLLWYIYFLLCLLIALSLIVNSSFGHGIASCGRTKWIYLFISEFLLQKMFVGSFWSTSIYVFMLYYFNFVTRTLVNVESIEGGAILNCFLFIHHQIKYKYTKFDSLRFKNPRTKSTLFNWSWPIF